MKTHDLKVQIKNWQKYFNDESWSLRKDDRGYHIGDICVFHAINTEDEYIECSSVVKKIINITVGYGLKDGYCILDLKMIGVT